MPVSRPSRSGCVADCPGGLWQNVPPLTQIPEQLSGGNIRWTDVNLLQPDWMSGCCRRHQRGQVSGVPGRRRLRVRLHCPIIFIYLFITLMFGLSFAGLIFYNIIVFVQISND